MIGTLIWALAVFIPCMTVVLWLTPGLYRAIEAQTAERAGTAAERDAAVQLTLVDIAERRHRLAVSGSLITEETEAARQKLAAETEQYRIDGQAAGKVLDEAVEARRRVIAARAQAEAELAPEAARGALANDGGKITQALAEAYTSYCEHCTIPMPFGSWASGFKVMSRG